jgi:hypothetical protein
VQGKLIRKSLKTDKISVAKLRLDDLQKELRQAAESQRGQARVWQAARSLGPAIERERFLPAAYCVLPIWPRRCSTCSASIPQGIFRILLGRPRPLTNSGVIIRELAGT